ncbi:hypothetical protein OCB14_19885 [Bacillus cereus]|nr:hypothetical protein [Bacillus cereus]MCU5543902.1 hypothetical protein [Bacillus cereus]
MSQEINQEMEALIRGWGLPEALEEQEDDIEYQFNDQRIVNNHEQTYHCKDGDVKFCLYNKVNNKALFTMDFFNKRPRIMGSRENERAIKLQLLYVIDDSLRGKKVAKFYVEKLQKYAIEKEMDCIHVDPYIEVDIFKNNMVNALSLRELEKFYDNLSTPEMPIKRIY